MIIVADTRNANEAVRCKIFCYFEFSLTVGIVSTVHRVIFECRKKNPSENLLTNEVSSFTIVILPHFHPLLVGRGVDTYRLWCVVFTKTAVPFFIFMLSSVDMIFFTLHR